MNLKVLSTLKGLRIIPLGFTVNDLNLDFSPIGFYLIFFIYLFNFCLFSTKKTLFFLPLNGFFWKTTPKLIVFLIVLIFGVYLAYICISPTFSLENACFAILHPPNHHFWDILNVRNILFVIRNNPTMVPTHEKKKSARFVDFWSAPKPRSLVLSCTARLYKISQNREKVHMWKV